MISESPPVTFPERIRSLADYGTIQLPSNKVVALTFDDGPGPATPEVLRILQEKHVKATFCMVGTAVDANQQLARDIAAAGMGLCNHSMNHDLRLSKKQLPYVQQQISSANDSIRNATGITPKIFRAPGGALSPEIVETARKNGMFIAHWSCDPRDWNKPGTQAIVDTTIKNAAPGAIILLHDGDGGGRNASNRAQTVEALPIIIDKLREQGYQFVDLAATTPEYH